MYVYSKLASENHPGRPASPITQAILKMFAHRKLKLFKH